MKQLSVGQKVQFKDKWNKIKDGIISQLNKPFPTVNDDGKRVNIYLTVVTDDMGYNRAIDNEQIINL